MSQNKPVECPLCYRSYSSNNIQNHVEHCSEKQEIQCKTPNLKRKLNEANLKVFKRVSPWNKITKPKVALGGFDACKDETSSPSLNKASFKSNDVKTASLNSLENSKNITKPLADLARPTTLEDYVGQPDVVGEGTPLYKLLCDNNAPSMILWGPPGCGKTTLAHIIANTAKRRSSLIHFVKMSATNSGKADVQSVIQTSKNEQQLFHRQTILFIDEIHRFNKLQQDTFLPHVENGTISLIGATTENPSFSLNSALLSRCRVIVLKKLEVEHVKALLVRAVTTFIPNSQIVKEKDEANLTQNDSLKADKIIVEDAALDVLSNYSDGDARTALNALQLAMQTVQSSADRKENIISVQLAQSVLQRTHILYDRTGDQHYEMISALHKSIRGNDDNAALYWLSRMIVGGEDPKYIARRLIRMASEDIGLADPSALNQAVACYHACHYVGMPECDVSLAQCVIYLARAPKSVEVYMAFNKAKKSIQEHEGPLPGVPLHLRNPSTKLMKNLGYGKDYKYTPFCDDEQTFLPDGAQDANYFASD